MTRPPYNERWQLPDDLSTADWAEQWRDYALALGEAAEKLCSSSERYRLTPTAENHMELFTDELALRGLLRQKDASK